MTEVRHEKALETEPLDALRGDRVVLEPLLRNYIGRASKKKEKKIKKIARPFEDPQGQSHGIFESQKRRTVCVEVKRAVIALVANSSH